MRYCKPTHTHRNHGRSTCSCKANGFAQLDTSDSKPMSKSRIDSIGGPCRGRLRSHQCEIPRSSANHLHQRVPTKIAYRCKPLRPAQPPWHFWTILLTRPASYSTRVHTRSRNVLGLMGCHEELRGDVPQEFAAGEGCRAQCIHTKQNTFL